MSCGIEPTPTEKDFQEMRDREKMSLSDIIIVVLFAIGMNIIFDWLDIDPLAAIMNLNESLKASIYNWLF